MKCFYKTMNFSTRKNTFTFPSNYSYFIILKNNYIVSSIKIIIKEKSEIKMPTIYLFKIYIRHLSNNKNITICSIVHLFYDVLPIDTNCQKLHKDFSFRQFSAGNCLRRDLRKCFKLTFLHDLRMSGLSDFF